MGVFNQILPKSQNLIFWYLGLLEFYCVVKTWNLNRNTKIALENGFGCLKQVSKVRSKHKFCSFFMCFTIRLRYKNTRNSFSGKLLQKKFYPLKCLKRLLIPKYPTYLCYWYSFTWIAKWIDCVTWTLDICLKIVLN